MSDKEFISRGAEVVTGDLILNRKVVGQYRNGQFIITPEGARELKEVVEVPATEVLVDETAAAPAHKTRAKRTKVVETESTPVPVDDTDGILVDSMDDIFKD